MGTPRYDLLADRSSRRNAQLERKRAGPETNAKAMHIPGFRWPERITPLASKATRIGGGDSHMPTPFKASEWHTPPCPMERRSSP
jgi:hypothetical protein